MVRRRLWRLFAAILIGLIAVTSRLAWLQVLSPDANLAERSRKRQYYSVELESYRGAVVARDGRTLATDRVTRDVVVPYGALVCSPRRSLRDLVRSAEDLGVEVEEARARVGSRTPEWLGKLGRLAHVPAAELLERRRLILDRVRRIRRSVAARRPKQAKSPGFRVKEELQSHVVLEGVPFDVASRIDAWPDCYAPMAVRYRRKRVYPMGRLACHVIGRLGAVDAGTDAHAPPGAETDPRKAYRAGDRIGVTGVEKTCDWVLRGRRGDRWMRRRPRGTPDELIREDPAEPGRTVVLTLDLKAQRAAEEALSGQVGAVVVLDVRNGETLVLASSPGFDLNLSGEALVKLFSSRPGRFANRAIQDALPCGSVAKVLTGIASIQSNCIDTIWKTDCDGSFRLGDRVFSCHGCGRVDIVEALRVSCNIFFYRAGLRAGPAHLAAWAARLGLGRPTGIDLPYERAGRFPTPRWKRHALGEPWYPGDTVNASIGQGFVEVTPIQVAVMMATVANGGHPVRPRVVRSPRTDGPAGAPRRRIAFRADVLTAMRRGLRSVVTSGTARDVEELRGLKVAGKTGTAQTGQEDVNHAWFAGYAPHDAPRYAFAVVVESTAAEGGEAAGPVAGKTLAALPCSPGR